MKGNLSKQIGRSRLEEGTPNKTVQIDQDGQYLMIINRSSRLRITNTSNLDDFHSLHSLLEVTLSPTTSTYTGFITSPPLRP